MKLFQTLINETLMVTDLEELEAAADLFQFGIEKGHYNMRQVGEFNNTYWKVKNKCLASAVADQVKGNRLDIINIVTKAPLEVKDNLDDLVFYVNGRIKALKGKINGIR